MLMIPYHQVNKLQSEPLYDRRHLYTGLVAEKQKVRLQEVWEQRERHTLSYFTVKECTNEATQVPTDCVQNIIKNNQTGCVIFSFKGCFHVQKQRAGSLDTDSELGVEGEMTKVIKELLYK